MIGRYRANHERHLGAPAAAASSPATAGYRTESIKQTAPAPAARVAWSSKPYGALDYSQSFAGSRLTPDRLVQILRAADGGQPLQMIDMFEEVTLRHGHLRGLFEQGHDEVAAQPYSWMPPPHDARKESKDAAQVLGEAMDELDVPGLVEHLLLADDFGYSFPELAWQRVGDLEVPVAIALVPHRRFVFDPDTFEPRITHEGNQWPGDPLEDRPGSSWIKAWSKRWRLKTQGGRLRTCAFYACYAGMSLRDWLIFLEKYGIPLVTGHYEEAVAAAARANLREALELLGREGYAILAEGARIQIHDKMLRGGGDGGPHPQMVHYCNSEISKVMIGATLAVEMGGPGSFAATKVHSDRAQTVAEARASRVGHLIQRWIGRPFIKRNGLTGIAGAPRLRCHVQRPLLPKAQTIKTLVEAGTPISAQFVQEEFEVRAPADENDRMVPPKTNAKADSPDDSPPP